MLNHTAAFRRLGRVNRAGTLEIRTGSLGVALGNQPQAASDTPGTPIVAWGSLSAVAEDILVVDDNLDLAVEDIPVVVGNLDLAAVEDNLAVVEGNLGLAVCA